MRDDERHPAIHGLASLPVFFNLVGKRALVAGGTPGAAWKAELLQAAGAQVDVFCAKPSAEMRNLAAQTTMVSLVGRAWTEDDLAGAVLAIGDFAAEADAARFREAAGRARVPVNVIDKPDYCDFQFGTIVDRSPLVIAISTGGAAPVFALALRGRLEALLPVSLKQWAQAARVWRPKLTEAKTRRRFWELFVARALSAQEPREADFAELQEHTSEHSPESGSLALIGISSADPELLTLKALRLLQAAESVFYDMRLPPEIIGMARRESRKIPVAAADDLSGRMIAEAAEGKHVAGLTMGDPADLFARLAAHADFHKSGIEIEIMPRAQS